MPVETTVTRCGNCGANLAPKPNTPSLRCEYCEQITWLAPTEGLAPVASPLGPPDASGASLHDRLMRGPSPSRVGSGSRRGPTQLRPGELASADRALWPVAASASSTYGGGWSPSAMIGPPRVFPTCGDRHGAWAPGPSRSDVEWVELEYGHEVPVAAVRVVETNRPGSTFAVVDASTGEELLYAGPTEARSEAAVLEIPVSPPRPIRRVRVYVINPGWAEIDTVGLVAAAPLPEALRTKAPAPTRWGRGCLVAIAATLALMIAFGVIGMLTGDSGARLNAAPRRPSASVQGATLGYSAPAPSELSARGVLWASAVQGFSSQYSSTRNAAAAAIGAPDVYPGEGDLSGAWASESKNRGVEWIAVEFPTPFVTQSVLWAETFNPGAVIRVDDLSDPNAPVVLWESAGDPHVTGSLIAELRLPAPRTIRALRFVLDTSRVTGWNEIDAIGLAPR